MQDTSMGAKMACHAYQYPRVSLVTYAEAVIMHIANLSATSYLYVRCTATAALYLT